MEKIPEFGRELGMDLMRAHDKLCQVHGKERARMSEAVSQLILRICDAAGTGTVETLPVVVSCLTELAENGIDPEDEESYYTDEEDHGEVNPTVAARGLGQVGNGPLADSPWSRCVPEHLNSRYQKWRQETHGVADGVGVREMQCWMPWFGMERCANTRTCGKAAVRHMSDLKVVGNVNSF